MFPTFFLGVEYSVKMTVRLVGGTSDLHSLCVKGDLKTMNESWTKYAHQLEVLKVGKTPLHEAAIKGHTSIIDFLLSKGAQPDTLSAIGETALYYAAEGKHTECEMILIDHKASVDAGMITPLGTQDKEFLTLLTSSCGKGKLCVTTYPCTAYSG